MPTRTICVRITPHQAQVLQNLKDQGEIVSVGEAVRVAIKDYLAKEYPAAEVTRKNKLVEA